MSTKFGTLDRDNPSVMYVSGRCWVTPCRKEIDQDAAVSRVRNDIRRTVSRMIGETKTFAPKMIIDIEFNSDKPVVGKKKKLTYDLYLKQTKSNVKPVEDIYGEMCHISSSVGYLIGERMEEYGFSVEKSKTI